MKNLLEYILIHLVENPENVQIDESQEGEVMVYTIHVHPDDIGRVIGKNGSIINSIRNIAKVRAVRENTRIKIDVAS